MSSSAANQYITRFAYGRTRAWWVRMDRGVDVKRMFSDAQHGGKRAALKAARRFRDSLLPKLKPAERGGTVERERPYGYVKTRERTFVSKSTGKTVTYQAVVAWVRNRDGSIASTNYSIERYGERRAREMAQGFVDTLTAKP